MAGVIVLGIGNLLMRDDGVGVHLVNRLAIEQARYPGIEFRDLGTSGLEALHAIAGRRKAIFLDCAVMGDSPGTLRRMLPEDLVSRKVLARLSSHEGDLLHLLDLSRQLGELPETVVIFGIEPADISPGVGLSLELEGRMEKYIEAVVGELGADNGD
ncbi:MAG: hydrogenase maturation protease [Armatimonadota bacterium]